MNTMNMPGFTAEISLYKHRKSYRMMENRNTNNASGVIPQRFPDLFCEMFDKLCKQGDIRGCTAYGLYCSVE